MKMMRRKQVSSGHRPWDPTGRSNQSGSGRLLIGMGIFMVFGLSACITSQRMMDNINGHYYKYTFAVREATTRKKTAIYDNGQFSVQFDPEYNRINFDLKNESTSELSILWDQTRLINDQDSSRVIHNGVRPGQGLTAAVAPTVIAPGTTLKDFILPLNLIRTVNNQQTIGDIYPEKDDSLSLQNDWMMGQIGQDLFALQLTVMVDGKVLHLPFHFYPIVLQRGAKSFKPQYGNGVTGSSTGTPAK